MWSPSHRRIQILHINYKKKETVVIKKEFNNLKLEYDEDESLTITGDEEQQNPNSFRLFRT